MSPEEKRRKILDKVRKLLAHAESTTFEGEADSFRERAEQLMISYAIEQWQLAAAGEAETRGGRPERRYFDWTWARTTPFREELDRMFDAVVRHCRCVEVIQRAQQTRDGRFEIPVIGLPSDLDYADLLFTTLLVQLVAQIDPEPSEKLSLEENLALLREAGLDWATISRKLLGADLLDDSYGRPEPEDDRQRFRQRHRRQAPSWYQRTGNRLAQRYRSYCRSSGRVPSRVDQRVYRKNFAQGFVSTVSTRLWRLEQKTSAPAAGSLALALRDIHRANLEARYDFYPELRPHAEDCACQKCESERAWRARFSPRRPRAEVVLHRRDRDRTDWAAYSAGSGAGDQAEIVQNAPRLKPRAALDEQTQQP